MPLSAHPIEAFIRSHGATCCRFIPARMLKPEERIRRYCYENKCGCYGRHLTCPPHSGTVPEIEARLASFRTGIVVQYSEAIAVQEDKEAVRRTKLRLHRIVLDVEHFLVEAGVAEVWGFIGGSCGLCTECAGYQNDPCPYPEKARISLESAAIDVCSLLERLGLDHRFLPDRITWTGMVLIKEAWAETQ